MRPLTLTLAMCLSILLSAAAAPRVPQWVDDALQTARTQAVSVYPRVMEAQMLPRSTEKGLRPTGDWTSGFYPGVLWYLYEYAPDEQTLSMARGATALLGKEQYRAVNHDIGFIIWCSYGNGWRLTGDEAYAKVAVRAAQSLTQRYSPATGLILSWDPQPKRDWKYPVIIDNMMNLELLCMATRLGGDKKFEEIALAHAEKTMKYHYRPDYSCPHVADYDPETGAFRKWDWNNGDDDPQTSVWSRGQGWSLYGFVMMYRLTGRADFLDQARHVADFLLTHPDMPADMVPYWDLSAPQKSKMRDSSSAAIIASALMELSTLVPDGGKYFTAGETMLKNLASPEYLAGPGTNDGFVLRHATGNYLRSSEMDGGLSYADYYFVEGLMRYIKISTGK